MKSNKIVFLCMLVMMGLMFQSCSEDEVLVEELAVEDRGLRPGGGGPTGGGPGGGPNDGGPNNGGATNFLAASLDNDILEDWTEVMLEVERYATGMRPNATARALAYIYLTAYETAIPGMPSKVSNADRLQGLQIRNERGNDNINLEIALNAGISKSMDHFLINVPANINTKISNLETELEDELSADLPNDVIRDSERWGEYVADQVIRYSRSDQQGERQIRSPQPTSYEPPTGDGFWTYSADEERALFPYWGSVRTFVVSTDQTTTLPPIEYSEDPNSEYYAQMKEVYELNNAAKNGDDEQLWIAEFWSDDVEGLMFSPPTRQFSIANQLLDQYELNLEEALTLYLKLGFAMNDAAVSTWKYKYEHMVMRPNVYIHEFMDPSFQTNLYRLVYWPNPSFPGYPSGHSCFASAAGGVFIDAFGNDTNFTDKSHEGRSEFQSAARSYDSFEELAYENAFSRIPLGVHIKMDCTEGLRLGYEISDGINELNLNRDPQ